MLSVNGLRELDGVEMMLFLFFGNVWLDIGMLGVSRGILSWDFIDSDLDMGCFFSDKWSLIS